MSGSLQMVLIARPSVKDCGPVVKFVIKMWPENMKRKKFPSVKGQFLVCSTEETRDATRHNHSGPPAVSILEDSAFAVDEQDVHAERPLF